MSYNRLYNCRNPNQGPQKHVLALCSGGLLRSPTTAWVLSNPPYDYNTRSAGVDEYHALQVIDEYLVEWADEIVCVEPRIRAGLAAWAAEKEADLSGKVIVTLDIPDRFRRRDPKLVAIIERQYQDWLNATTAVPARA